MYNAYLLSIYVFPSSSNPFAVILRVQFPSLYSFSYYRCHSTRSLFLECLNFLLFLARRHMRCHCHVVALNLTGLHLSKTLSADIAHLPFLSNLSLADNKFSDPIPPPLSSLSALRFLNLSNNCFNQTFLPELSRLQTLEVLNLYNNNMTDPLPMAVA
ncbi:uncharacterized protein HKW66_Vig0170370 [Vigna angularis]|uniref:Leucine-rich repeat-containing N-terminal plant-type domain-containing protein n=1 Tax=Phaseolus angularis TaxID=3914 RepID=A0A8T0JPT9_PHAAN|nr:uncharacterized protein HKW66_Vig0170370 [Vigna angularis]